MELGNTRISKAFIKLNDESKQAKLEKYTHFIAKLAKSDEIGFVSENLSKASADISENLKVFVPLESVDLSGVLSRLESQKIKLGKEKSKLEAMLGNAKFMQNAPKEVIEQNKTALKSLVEQFAKIDEELKNLKGE